MFQTDQRKFWHWSLKGMYLSNRGYTDVYPPFFCILYKSHLLCNFFTLRVGCVTQPLFPGLRETGFVELAYKDLFQLICTFLNVVGTSSIFPHK